VDFFKGQKEWQNDETIRHFFSSYSIWMIIFLH
jgi:hypothetical protein